jgi:hypothetical protein
MKILVNTLKTWLPLAAAISLLSGLIYVTVQQAYRSGADDPQVQMAEDAARLLAAGQPADSILPEDQVDIDQSLAPYLILFDADGNPVASNARLHGQTPQPPAGVFDYTRQHGQNRVTWQPEPGVRSATVIVAVSGQQIGFVLAGRSLREVEVRESRLTQMVALGCLATLLVTLGLTALFETLAWMRSRA